VIAAVPVLEVDNIRVELQHALGRLLFAHTARLQRAGKPGELARAAVLLDVFEITCVISPDDELDDLVEILVGVIERFRRGEVTP